MSIIKLRKVYRWVCQWRKIKVGEYSAKLQERGCLMHFAHLANTLLKDEESPRDNILLACNFAKYSPIQKFTERLNIGASQPLNSGTLSLYLSVPVPVLTPSVVISRPTTASRPSNPLNPSPLAPQIRLCWPLCALINNMYLLTYCAKRCTCWQRSLQLRASQLLAR